MSDYSLIEDEAGVAAFVDKIVGLTPSPAPSLYVDIEGVNLGRHGSISIIQVFVLPLQHTYLLDVHKLLSKTFTTPGVENPDENLKTILESATIPKALFDVRNDNDALFNLYGIEMRCVQDIQLMELARRPGNRTYLSGLAKAIENDLSLSWVERARLHTVKAKGRALFAPELGGSYEVFNQRPLSDDVREYCVQDVVMLPRLWATYNAFLNAVAKRMVAEATADRLKLAKEADYNGKGRERALGPPVFWRNNVF